MSGDVYFGYQTALQILRAAHPSELVPARGRAQRPPDQAPSKRDVLRALARLESAYPELVLERPAHVLTGRGSRCRTSSVCHPHACAADLSGGSFYRLGYDVHFSTAAHAFVHMATQAVDEIDLIELGWELCGSYRTRRTSARSAYQVKPLTTVRALRSYVSDNHSVDGARKAARIIRYLSDGSASPRETKFALTLGLPMMRGGQGVGIPRMNYEVVASKAARAISGRATLRCDLCWPEAKLDVEYQSREYHEGEASRIKDSRRTNALIAMGWTVICVTDNELNSLAATDVIAQSIRRKLGKRRHMNVSDHHARILKLRRQLGLPVVRYE